MTNHYPSPIHLMNADGAPGSHQPPD